MADGQDWMEARRIRAFWFRCEISDEEIIGFIYTISTPADLRSDDLRFKSTHQTAENPLARLNDWVVCVCVCVDLM